MILTDKSIYLRLANEFDAKFILSLRTDERLNRFITKTDSTLERQIEWLRKYKVREQDGEEFYFIVHRIDSDIPIGTARIYDFLGEENSFCWGSWILNSDKPKYAAIECICLVFDFAFFTLGFERAHIDFIKENESVINFHKRIGMTIYRQDKTSVYGYIYKSDYLKIKDDFKKISLK